MKLWVAAVLACGCFDPRPHAGIPCGADGECPGAQVCDQQMSPPTCVDTLTPGDGGGDDAPDAEVLGIDAPPPGACVADSDCTGGVCHELTGDCVPDAETLFLAPTGSGTACTRTAPCGTLQAAIDARTATRTMIALAAGTYAASWDLMQAGVDTMIVSGPTRDWADATIQSNNQNRIPTALTAVFEGVTITGGMDPAVDTRGTVTLSRVLISQGSGGPLMRGGTLTILDSKIDGTTGDGISAEGGTLVVQRSQVTNNDRYGIDVQGGGFTIVNTIITSNGSIAGTSGGARLNPSQGQPAVFRFNTLARNTGANVASIDCRGSIAIVSSIVNESGLIFPPISLQCMPTYSLFNPNYLGGTPMGTGNLSGDPKFVSMTDFHLQAGSPAIDKANPNNAEAIDIDGQQRVAPPDIGADERP